MIVYTSVAVVANEDAICKDSSSTLRPKNYMMYFCANSTTISTLAIVTLYYLITYFLAKLVSFSLFWYSSTMYWFGNRSKSHFLSPCKIPIARDACWLVQFSISVFVFIFCFKWMYKSSFVYFSFAFFFNKLLIKSSCLSVALD